MDDGSTLPWPGLLLAVATSAILLVAGLDPRLTLLLLIVWGGSLWLVQPRPQPELVQQDVGAFSKERMAEMIEHSGTPLILTEGNRIIIANRVARETIGTHVIGQDVRVAFRHPQAIALINQRRAGEAIVTGLARPKDVWRISRYEMQDDLAVIELVSKSAEADLSRAHTDFVANASHELRTPLASIIGYVETLRDDPTGLDGKTSQRFLDTIHREARRLQALVSDLMSLSRIEAEKHELPQQKVSLNEVVDRAARDAAAPQGRLERLNLSLEETLHIAGDQQQLEQLARNLVDNAFKYGGEASPVDVVLSRNANEEAKLEVTDHGAGIPAEHLPHLTRRFYRTDPGRSLASGGTGLGLAIVKHIVQRHRGRLDIASEVGRGTTITVRIPIWSGTEDNEAPIEPSEETQAAELN